LFRIAATLEGAPRVSAGGGWEPGVSGRERGRRAAWANKKGKAGTQAGGWSAKKRLVQDLALCRREEKRGADFMRLTGNGRKGTFLWGGLPH